MWERWSRAGILPALFFLVLLVGTCWGGEKEVAKEAGKMPALQSYDLPRDQVQEYGRLEAEGRALRAESALALQEIEKGRAEILEKWKALVGGDLKGWQLDLAKGQLRKIGEKQK